MNSQTSQNSKNYRFLRILCLSGWAQKHDFLVRFIENQLRVLNQTPNYDSNPLNFFTNNSSAASTKSSFLNINDSDFSKKASLEVSNSTSLDQRFLNHFQDKKHYISKPAIEKNLKFLPYSLELISANYLSCDSFDEFCKKLTALGNFDAILGWSLGGAIAMRLVSEKILQPNYLALVATSFAVVNDEILEEKLKKDDKSHNYKAFTAISKKDFLSIRREVENDTESGLARFASLASLGGSREERLNMKSSQILSAEGFNLKNLLYWLDLLESFKAAALPSCNWPKTLIIHGKNDKIIHHSQSQILSSLIASSHIEIFENCAHAPIFNNWQRFYSLVLNFFSSNAQFLK